MSALRSFVVGAVVPARLTWDCPTCPPMRRAVELHEDLDGRSVAAVIAAVEADPSCPYCRRDRGELVLVGHRFVRPEHAREAREQERLARGR